MSDPQNPVLPHDESKEPRPTYPVRVRRMRMAYRDILTSSGAGEALCRTLAHTPPIYLIEQFTLSWTGLADEPLALRRQGFHPSDDCTANPKPCGTWYYFKAGSAMEQIIEKESRAYYPDATRNYSYLDLRHYRIYILVIGNMVISVRFDQTDELARLPQQQNSLLDMIARSLLDFRQRELRHLQDQMVMIQTPQAASKDDPEALDRQTQQLFLSHGNILESFFGFQQIQVSLARDLASVLLPRTSENTQWVEPDQMLSLTIDLESYHPPRTHGSPGEILKSPMYWGSNNEEGLFTVTLLSMHPINPHVRRELLLNQALFRFKNALENLFDIRYRELRMAQDYEHFQRCKVVRSQTVDFQAIKDHVLDSLPEYCRMSRTMPRNLLFPEWAAHETALGKVFMDTQADPLEFRPQIRLKKLNEYNYLDIHTPEELMELLREGLRQAICFTFDSNHPVLKRLSDKPWPSSSPGSQGEQDKPGEEKAGGTERVLCFNDAATISINLPETVIFHFQRMQKMANEYLESAGEGMGRLFQSINLQSGIPNRSTLVQTLGFLVNQVQYADLVELEVSSMDIVRFKIFNELFGHPFGDRVIRYVAHQLEERVPGSAFHVSGDEFYLVQCHTTRNSDSWVAKFFSSKGIIDQSLYELRRARVEEFAKGIAVPVIFDHTKDKFAPSPLGTYNLADFIGNFFTINAGGTVNLKEYSRTGRDYYRVIHDPQRRIQALVDTTWEALGSGMIELGSQGFRDFVYQNSTLDRFIYIIPRLTIGTVSYNHKTVLSYPSDILEAAEGEAGRNKK